MAEIQNISATFVLPTVLPCAQMATEQTLRKRILRLTEFGITQKEIAGRIGVSESWLSRWLRERPARPINVQEMDALEHYVAAIIDALTQEPPHAQQDQRPTEPFRPTLKDQTIHPRRSTAKHASKRANR
jgi:transcriptional regulator with XRE-family HTH domain